MTVAGPHEHRFAWVPEYVCTPECLPPGGDRVGHLRFGVRMVTLLAVLLVTVAGIVLLRGGAQAVWRRRTSRLALRAAGVRLAAAGRFPDGGALVVANHLSWIDVLALDALGPVRMLAKREIAGWPVLGGLAVRVGALFVDRAGLRSLPGTVAETAAALRGGALVGVFPEGTTWCGAAAGEFRRAAFQAAIDAGVPVQPVALVLRLPDGTPGRAGAFVGDQTLWDSLCRVLRLPGLTCELTVLPALPPHADRRGLAAAAGRAITEVTDTPHPVRRRPATHLVASAA